MVFLVDGSSARAVDEKARLDRQITLAVDRGGLDLDVATALAQRKFDDKVHKLATSGMVGTKHEFLGLMLRDLDES